MSEYANLNEPPEFHSRYKPARRCVVVIWILAVLALTSLAAWLGCAAWDHSVARHAVPPVGAVVEVPAGPAPPPPSKAPIVSDEDPSGEAQDAARAEQKAGEETPDQNGAAFDAQEDSGAASGSESQPD